MEENNGNSSSKNWPSSENILKIKSTGLIQGREADGGASLGNKRKM